MAKQSINWGSVLFLVVPLLEFAGYLLFESAIESRYLFFMLVIAGISFVLVFWMCVSHSYNFTQSALVFRAGPFRKTVALVDIFEVMPTHDGVPRSRGAVRIRYYMTGIAGDSFMMIPRNQAEFLAEFARRCPHLEAFGDGLKRDSSTKATT